MTILRDAYLKNGSYNVFVVDWSALCESPCYPAAVANLRPVAKCLAGTLTILRNLGLPITRTTCVGHSLGAHLCGIMANYLLFRMHKYVIVLSRREYRHVRPFDIPSLLFVFNSLILFSYMTSRRFSSRINFGDTRDWTSDKRIISARHEDLRCGDVTG